MTYGLPPPIRHSLRSCHPPPVGGRAWGWAGGAQYLGRCPLVAPMRGDVTSLRVTEGFETLSSAHFVRVHCLTRVEPRVRSTFARQMRSLTAKRRPQHTVLMCENCILRPKRDSEEYLSPRHFEPRRGEKSQRTRFLTYVRNDVWASPPHPSLAPLVPPSPRWG